MRTMGPVGTVTIQRWHSPYKGQRWCTSGQWWSSKNGDPCCWFSDLSRKASKLDTYVKSPNCQRLANWLKVYLSVYGSCKTCLWAECSLRAYSRKLLPGIINSFGPSPSQWENRIQKSELTKITELIGCQTWVSWSYVLSSFWVLLWFLIGRTDSPLSRNNFLQTDLDLSAIRR